MSKKLIIFDLDNTLIITSIAAKDAYKQAINYIAKQHGIFHNRYKLYNHWKNIVQKLKNEQDPSKRLFNYSLSQLLVSHKIPDTYLSQALAVFNKEFLNKLTLQKGVKPLLNWLKDQKHTIAVATESRKSQAKQKIKAVGIYKDVDLLITANDVGVMKPSPQYYQLALNTTGISKKDTVVIGDRQKQDLDPATKIGIKNTILVPANKFHLGTVKSKLEGIFTS